jgi:hypothetical protein
VFFRRKSPPVAQPPATARVIVKSSAVDLAREGRDHHTLVGAVVDFVNAALQQGYFLRDELLQKALQVYHADYYLEQVNNGGHSQFIHNSRSIAQHVCSDALNGLDAMNAPHAAVLRSMMTWVAAHPDEAKLQTGFEGGRAPYLDELDRHFYQTEQQTGLAGLAARWTLSWPELIVVPDHEYPERIQQFCNSNPERMQRQFVRQLQGLIAQTTDRFRMSVGLAATAIEPPETLLSIGGGAYETIEGSSELAYRIRTNAGSRVAVVTDETTRIYDFADPDGDTMRDITRTKGQRAAFEFYKSDAYRKPQVGARLSSVTSSEVSAAIEESSRHLAGAAIAVLLGKYGIQDLSASISPMRPVVATDGNREICWFATIADNLFVVHSTLQGATLRLFDEDGLLASCSRDEARELLRQHGLEQIGQNT